MFSVFNKRLLVSFLLISIGIDFFAQDVFDASRKGNVERIKELMKINPDTIHKKNEAGFLPLILAGYHGQLKVVEFLLENRVDINATSPEGPVILGACYKGNLELVALLIKNKADVNVQNEIGTTALIYAVIANNIELVKLLLKNGAKKELEEKSGRTALGYARMYGFKELELVLSN